MKKILAILLIVSLTSAFAACNSDKTSRSSEESSAVQNEVSTSQTSSMSESSSSKPNSAFTSQSLSDNRTTNLLDLSLLSDGQPHYTERVAYAKWQRGELAKIPELGDMGFDLRSFDVSAFDLSAATSEFNEIYFDTWTVWPDKLPENFDAQAVMELGKDPGLGIRSLHEQGITGKGVNIAIIDQALVQDHTEYADRLMTYETIQSSDESAQMHGSAVTSIAAGKTCGVAPDAKIYYIASTFGIFSPNGGFREDMRPIAESIERILAINEVLPADEKIKVISISKGITNVQGVQEALAAIEKAKKCGVFVITVDTDKTHGFSLMGLGRGLLADPNDLYSYLPGKFWANSFYENRMPQQTTLLVPMDARSYAGWGDTTGYEFGTAGGLSWSVPWLAGMYALCLQENPDLSSDDFISICLETGNSLIINHDGKEYTLEKVIDPIKVMEQIR